LLQFGIDAIMLLYQVVAKLTKLESRLILPEDGALAFGRGWCEGAGIGPVVFPA
jgi:hypothetical protein